MEKNGGGIKKQNLVLKISSEAFVLGTSNLPEWLFT